MIIPSLSVFKQTNMTLTALNDLLHRMSCLFFMHFMSCCCHRSVVISRRLLQESDDFLTYLTPATRLLCLRQEMNRVDLTLSAQKDASYINISDRNSLKICMYYLNFLPIRYELILRTIKFLFKCAQTENAIVSGCYNS